MTLRFGDFEIPSLTLYDQTSPLSSLAQPDEIQRVSFPSDSVTAPNLSYAPGNAAWRVTACVTEILKFLASVRFSFKVYMCISPA
jgi:hypothetical protein